MDPISYGVAAKQRQRIERILKEPDSNSGLVTMPSTIAVGETITIPAGRVVVHPNLQIDGTLDIQGDLFIPAGGTISDMVSLTEDQTISGVKTFTSSPIVPTPTNGDNSTKVATTAYVQTNASGAKGGGTDKVFFENDQVVTADYTITSGKNAMSAGVVTINNGVTVTIPSGSTWVVV